MKKALLFLLCVALGGTVVKAQTSFFDPEDIDAGGWLWFDSQAKIDKYFGYGNLPDDMHKIQVMDAQFENEGGEFEVCEVDPNMVGYGTDGVLGGPGAITGGIKLPGSAGSMQYNGGGILLNLPSCSQMSVCLSCDDKMTPALLMGPGKSELIDMQLVRGYMLLRPLSKAGIYRWNNMQELAHSETGATIKSSGPVSVYVVNSRPHHLILHGIQVYTDGVNAIETVKNDNPLGMVYAGNTVTLKEPAQVRVYNVSGSLVKSETSSVVDMNDLPKGMYIIKAQNGNIGDTAKVLVR